MRCENCGAYASRADDRCRKCGATLRNLRLPAKRPQTQPTLWQQAAPVLARGAALVALGVVAEMALTTLAKGVFRMPSLRPAKGKLPARRNGDLPEGAYTVSETVIIRRLILRR